MVRSTGEGPLEAEDSEVSDPGRRRFRARRGRPTGGVHKSSRSRRLSGARVLRILALLLFGAGCLASGAAIGWWIRDSQNEALAPITVEAVIDRPVAVTGVANVGLGQMPGVLGLPLDQARRVLFDSGVPAVAITFNQRPTALEPGLVVLQEPPAGSALADAVSLVVSTEAVVPDMAGMPLEEAEALLADFGANPTIQRGSNAGAQAGIVLGSDPPAGETLRRSIVLYVSSP